jgi:predicted esterase
LPNENAPEDEEEILHSVGTVVDIIDNLIKQGILCKRIVVGGQRQGHCIALLMGLVSKYSGQLGGVIGQCGYLPLLD